VTTCNIAGFVKVELASFACKLAVLRFQSCCALLQLAGAACQTTAQEKDLPFFYIPYSKVNERE
jgi:hypothetical protein